MEYKIMENEQMKEQCDVIVRLSYLMNGDKMYELLRSIEKHEVKDRILNHRWFRNRMTGLQNVMIVKDYFKDPVVNYRKGVKRQKLDDYYAERVKKDPAIDAKSIADAYGRKFTGVALEVYYVQKETLTKLIERFPEKFSEKGKDEQLLLENSLEMVIRDWTDGLESKAYETFFHGGIYKEYDRRVQVSLEAGLIEVFNSDIIVGILKQLYTNDAKKRLLEQVVALNKVSLEDVQSVILSFDQTPQIQLKKKLCETDERKLQIMSDQIEREQTNTFYHLVNTYPTLSFGEEKDRYNVLESFYNTVHDSLKTRNEKWLPKQKNLSLVKEAK